VAEFDHIAKNDGLLIFHLLLIGILAAVSLLLVDLLLTRSNDQVRSLIHPDPPEPLLLVDLLLTRSNDSVR
jgi:hypothetical protein